MLNFLCSLTIFASLCSASPLGASTFIVQQGGTGSTTLSGILKGNGTSAIGSVIIGPNLSFDGTTLSATGGSGSGNVSTSTTETAGQVAYWTSTGATPATLGKVATSSLDVSYPLSSSAALGALVGGSNATLSLAFGTTTSNTWAETQTFTNSPAITALTGGLVYSNATTDTLANVSTTTLAVSGPFTVSGTLGNLVGGSNSTITWNGLATTSQPASSNLLVSNGGTGVFGVATTSLSGNSQIALSQPVSVIGASASTLSIVGDSIGDTQLAFNTGQNLTTASSPTFANLTVNYASTTAVSGTALCISTDCRTAWPAGGSGLSTSSPLSSGNLLYYSGTGAGSAVGVATSSATLGLGLSGTLTTVGSGQSLSIATSSLYTGTTGQFPYFSGTNTITATSSLFVATSGRIGVGSTTPGSDLSIGSTNGINLFAGASTTATSTFPGNIDTFGALSFKNNGQTNYIKQHRLGFLDIVRDGADYTLARIRAPLNDSNEATLSLVVDRDTPSAGVNEEFIDFYNERYADSVQWGIRQAYSGTGIPKPGVFGFWNTAGGKDVGNQFLLMPNGTSAFARATSTVDTNAMLYIASSTAAAPLIVDGAPGTELFRVLLNGNIGIASTSPYAKLSIDAPAGVASYLSIGSSTGQVLTVTPSATAKLIIGTTTAGCAQFSASGELTSTGSGCGGSGSPGGSGSELQYRAGASTFGGIPNSAVDASNGAVGFGSTTPWANFAIASSTWGAVAADYNRPLFAVATSSSLSGELFSITATSTGSSFGGVTSALSNGARIVMGEFSKIVSSFTLFLNGPYSSSWSNNFCDRMYLLATLSADTLNVCGGFVSFDEGSTATLANSSFGPGGVGEYGGVLMSITNGTASDSAMLHGGPHRAEYIGSSTPKMEVIIGELNNVSTTTGFYIGFEDIAPGGGNNNPSRGCYFAATTTANWLAVCDNGTNETIVNTGFATSTAATYAAKMRIEMGPSVANFYMSSSEYNVYTRVASITGTIPTGNAIAPNVHIRRIAGGTSIAPEIRVAAFRLWYAVPFFSTELPF